VKLISRVTLCTSSFVHFYTSSLTEQLQREQKSNPSPPPPRQVGASKDPSSIGGWRMLSLIIGSNTQLMGGGGRGQEDIEFQFLIEVTHW
jgi:hypothetical protein